MPIFRIKNKNNYILRMFVLSEESSYPRNIRVFFMTDKVRLILSGLSKITFFIQMVILALSVVSLSGFENSFIIKSRVLSGWGVDLAEFMIIEFYLLFFISIMMLILFSAPLYMSKKVNMDLDDGVEINKETSKSYTIAAIANTALPALLAALIIYANRGVMILEVEFLLVFFAMSALCVSHAITYKNTFFNKL